MAMTTMVLLDPVAMTVKTVLASPGTEHAKAKEWIGCDMVDMVVFHREDEPSRPTFIAIVDDEGLLRPWSEQEFTMLADEYGERVLSGRVVLVPVDAEGGFDPEATVYAADGEGEHEALFALSLDRNDKAVVVCAFCDKEGVARASARGLFDTRITTNGKTETIPVRPHENV
jgi:hypothetical protein